MSYSVGLGTAITDKARVARLAPATTDAFRLVPPDCERTATIIQGIWPMVAAGQLVVVAWPFVTLSDVQVRSALDAIVGSGANGGGPAVLAGLTPFALNATTTSTSQTSQVTPDEVKRRAAAMAPTFLAAGFIRDAEMDQSQSRGYLWLAARWSGPTATVDLVNILRSILRAATPAESIWNRAMVPGKIKHQPGLVVTAENESDVALEAAAKNSVIAFMQGWSALAEVFSVILGSRTVSSAAVALRNDFKTTSQRMGNAASAIDAARAIVARAPMVATAALALPAESQPAAGAALAEMRLALGANKTSILNGMQAARPTLDTCAQERSDGSPLARRIRELIVQDAGKKLESRGPTVAVDFQKCQLWRRAQAQLDTELRGLSAEIQSACLIATGLSTNSASLAALITQIDSVIVRLDYVMSQLRMDWWKRNHWGVPVMYWMAAGGVMVVGGGIAIKTVRRRRRAARARASASASAPVAKNRVRS